MESIRESIADAMNFVKTKCHELQVDQRFKCMFMALGLGACKLDIARAGV